MAKNTSSNRGVILRGRGAGFGFWSGETSADGGKQYLRRRARRIGRQEWLAELRAEGII